MMCPPHTKPKVSCFYKAFGVEMARYAAYKSPRVKTNEILKQFENEWKKNPSVRQRRSLISFQYSVKSWTLSYQVDREYLRFLSLSQGPI